MYTYANTHITYTDTTITVIIRGIYQSNFHS